MKRGGGGGKSSNMALRRVLKVVYAFVLCRVMGLVSVLAKETLESCKYSITKRGQRTEAKYSFDKGMIDEDVWRIFPCSKIPHLSFALFTPSSTIHLAISTYENVMKLPTGGNDTFS